MSLIKALLPVLAVLLVALVTACGSSDSKSTSPTPQPSPGKITAIATGITGQTGKTYAVAALDYDWRPGASEPAVGGIMGTISSDDFSFTSVLRITDAQGNLTGNIAQEEKVFEPKTYSVVFFVADPGSPPQYLAEVRISVNGDVRATAPRWVDWVHQ